MIEIHPIMGAHFRAAYDRTRKPIGSRIFKPATPIQLRHFNRPNPVGMRLGAKLEAGLLLGQSPVSRPVDSGSQCNQLLPKSRSPGHLTGLATYRSATNES